MQRYNTSTANSVFLPLHANKNMSLTMPYADLISLQNSEGMEIITLLKVIKDALITLIEGFLVENPLYQPKERGEFT